MNESDIRDKFVVKFNELEKYLRIESNTQFNESQYVKNLQESKNKLINIKNNKDFLLIAGKIRNLMVHNNDVAFPTNKFLKEFELLVDKIISPKKGSEVMIPKDKCLFAEYNQTLLEVAIEMKKRQITTVPVLSEGKVTGAFTETSLFQSLLDENGEIIGSLNDMYFKDYRDKFTLDANTYYTYQFISRKLSVYECLEKFEKGYTKDKKLELLFVTENGKNDERLLGIISIFDLLEYIEY